MLKIPFTPNLVYDQLVLLTQKKTRQSRISIPDIYLKDVFLKRTRKQSRVTNYLDYYQYIYEKYTY